MREFPVSAATEGDYDFDVSDGNATITYYSGPGGDRDLTIPSTLGGYPVTSIGQSAFFMCKGGGPTSVTIPDSVTSIEAAAFLQCTSLTSVTIPESVTSLGDNAFAGCGKLMTASFLGNAPQMGVGVFDKAAANFKVHYISGKSGFTDPWNGYKTTASNNPPVLMIAAGVLVVVSGALVLLLFLRKKRKQT